MLKPEPQSIEVGGGLGIKEESWLRGEPALSTCWVGGRQVQCLPSAWSPQGVWLLRFLQSTKADKHVEASQLSSQTRRVMLKASSSRREQGFSRRPVRPDQHHLSASEKAGEMA